MYLNECEDKGAGHSRRDIDIREVERKELRNVNVEAEFQRSQYSIRLKINARGITLHERRASGLITQSGRHRDGSLLN